MHREVKRYMPTIMGLGNALDHGCTVGKNIFILDAGAAYIFRLHAHSLACMLTNLRSVSTWFTYGLTCLVAHLPHTAAVSTIPDVTLALWVKGQKLLKKGYMNLAYAWKEGLIVIPSTHMLQEHVPSTCDTLEKQRYFLKTWANEFKV